MTESSQTTSAVAEIVAWADYVQRDVSFVKVDGFDETRHYPERDEFARVTCIIDDRGDEPVEAWVIQRWTGEANWPAAIDGATIYQCLADDGDSYEVTYDADDFDFSPRRGWETY